MYKRRSHESAFIGDSASLFSAGSLKLAEETLKELEDYDVVMWEKHGVFAKGLDVMDAFDQIDVLSKSAKIYIDSKCMGFEPDGMSQEEMAEMTKAFNLPR